MKSKLLNSVFILIVLIISILLQFCKEETTSPIVTVIAAPSSLGATAVSSTQIDLVWTDNSDNELGFKIERAPGGTTNFAEIAIVGANVTSYQNTGLSASTGYSYRVRAYNSSGNSGYSNTAMAMTLENPPTAPINLSATPASSTQINLSWTDNSNNEQGFRIERAPGGTTSFAEITTVGAGITSYQNTGLSASTSYSYRVRAYNSSGNSGYSNTATATTPAGQVNVPAAPTNLSATPASSTQINLSWTDNSNNEQGFRIERAPGGTTSFAEITTVGAGITSYQNTGLSASTSYSYRVRAYNSSGNSGYSNTATATTPAGQVNVPAAPTNLSATPASSTQINLSWTDNSNNEQGFKIERAPGGTTSFTEIATVGANINSYQNTGLSASTSYSYRVRAYNSSGNSGYSNTATATTPGNPPTAPTNLSATPASSTQINLSWTDNSNNEQGFRIERAPGGTTSFAEITTVGAGITSYQNTGLSASTSYSYRVRAYNSSGNSGYSNTATVTTPGNPPTVPTNLSATPASSTQINLSWTDNSDNEQGFKVERAPGGTTSFTEIATVGANTISYQNTGLSVSTEYNYRVRAYNSSGNSGYSNTATATTLSEQPSGPGISAPSTSSGSFTVTLTYSWPTLGTNWDRYELEESTSPTSGFVNIHTSEYGIHTSPYYIQLTKSSGTYYYRARVYRGFGSNPGYSQYSSVISVVVTQQPRQITIINNISTGCFLQEVVRVKEATTYNGVFTRNDLLTDDPAYCLSLPGESILNGGSTSFNMTLGNNYYVFIGIGKWETDLFFCSSSIPWFKRNYFTDTNWINHYVWIVIQVSGHTSGNWNWTISGSYLNGTLKVTPSGNNPLYFSMTDNDPIP